MNANESNIFSLSPCTYSRIMYANILFFEFSEKHVCFFSVTRAVTILLRYFVYERKLVSGKVDVFV